MSSKARKTSWATATATALCSAFPSWHARTGSIGFQRHLWCLKGLRPSRGLRKYCRMPGACKLALSRSASPRAVVLLGACCDSELCLWINTLRPQEIGAAWESPERSFEVLCAGTSVTNLRPSKAECRKSPYLEVHG